jgi:hypothetical protein
MFSERHTVERNEKVLSVSKKTFKTVDIHCLRHVLLTREFARIYHFQIEYFHRTCMPFLAINVSSPDT